MKNAEFTIIATEKQEKGGEYRKAGIYISLVNAINWNIFKTGDISIENLKKGIN